MHEFEFVDLCELEVRPAGKIVGQVADQAL